MKTTALINGEEKEYDYAVETKQEAEELQDKGYIFIGQGYPCKIGNHPVNSKIKCFFFTNGN